MPIQGLSDETTRNETPISYPLWGKFHKGAEKPERGVGRNLDYFRIDWLDISAQTAFEALYGDSPQSIPIVTLSKTVDSVFDSWYRKYTSNNVLQIKCDGCQIVKAANRDLIGQDCICDPNERRKDNPKTCNPQGYLYFTIPEICQRLGYIGQFMLGTGSPIEISEISAALQTVSNVAGTLEYQRFLLQRSERKFDIEIDGKPAQVNQWMVEVVPPIDNILPFVRNPEKQLPTVPQLEAAQEAIEPEQIEDIIDNSQITPFDTYKDKLTEWVKKYLGMEMDSFLFHFDNAPLADIEALYDLQDDIDVIGKMIRDWCIEKNHLIRVYGVRTESWRDNQNRFIVYFGFGNFYHYGWKEVMTEALYEKMNADYVNSQGVKTNPYRVGDHAFKDVFGLEYLSMILERTSSGEVKMKQITDDIPF